MSRAISIAGVRPLGWLARVRAQRSCSARACPAGQLLGAGAAGLAPRARAARRWAWERAMIVRVCARRANGSADGFLCAREQVWAVDLLSSTR
jgi:hypothetical protein